jgi:hypothetical protein
MQVAGGGMYIYILIIIILLIIRKTCKLPYARLQGLQGCKIEEILEKKCGNFWMFEIYFVPL